MNFMPQVFIGQVKTTEQCGDSAIFKTPILSTLELSRLGLQGDEQADQRVHGGADRALCHYPQEHYEYWQQQYPALANIFMTSAFGENLSTIGMNETNVHMGDVYQWGNSLIQVTQPRSPCYKLNGLTGIDDFALTMQESGKIGWLYRVIRTGMVSAAEPLQLIQRSCELSISEVTAIAFHEVYNETNTKKLLSAAGLSASWTATMLNRLKTEKIEDFSRRLFKG